MGGGEQVGGRAQVYQQVEGPGGVGDRYFVEGHTVFFGCFKGVAAEGAVGFFRAGLLAGF